MTDKYIRYDEMMEILDNKYLLPFRKDERLRGLNGIDIVRCEDCKFNKKCTLQHYWTVDGFTEEIEHCSLGKRRDE